MGRPRRTDVTESKFKCLYLDLSLTVEEVLVKLGCDASLLYRLCDRFQVPRRTDPGFVAYLQQYLRDAAKEKKKSA